VSKCFFCRQVIRWPGNPSTHEEQSVAITFTEQFDQLNEQPLDISNLFKILSFLDPKNIPTKMIVNGAKEWLRSQNELQPPPSSSKPIILEPGHKDSDIKYPPDTISEGSRVSAQFRSLVTLILSPVQFHSYAETPKPVSSRTSN
jgi:hypothetical protein